MCIAEADQVDWGDSAPESDGEPNELAADLVHKAVDAAEGVPAMISHAGEVVAMIARAGKKKKRNNRPIADPAKASAPAPAEGVGEGDGAGSEAKGVDATYGYQMSYTLDTIAQYDLEIPDAGKPRCCKCKTIIDETKQGRVFGKCFASWICKVCNVRQVQMHRNDRDKAFAQGFKKMPADERTQFYNDIQGMTEKQIANHMGEYLKKWRETQDLAREYGDYQPLSWYANQGYDAALIKERCTNTQDHPVLGTCYKVNITGGGRTTIEGTHRETIVSGTADMSYILFFGSPQNLPEPLVPGLNQPLEIT
jgi:hypothetical protein